jgi:hypothetical protein
MSHVKVFILKFARYRSQLQLSWFYAQDNNWHKFEREFEVIYGVCEPCTFTGNRVFKFQPLLMPPQNSPLQPQKAQNKLEIGVRGFRFQLSFKTVISYFVTIWEESTANLF